MQRYLFLYILCLLAPTVQAQYYFSAPELLSDTINSRAEESYPLYSARDSTLYFVRTLFSANTGGGSGGQDIWYSKKTAQGGWSVPTNLEPLNNRRNNAVVGVSRTGSTLYLLNDYGSENPGLAFSFRQDDRWLAPSDISIPSLANKLGSYYGIYVTPSEDIAVLSMQQANALGQEDLYVSFKDPATGQWSEPLHLGEIVNTEGYEISPFLSEDKKMLFFASNGHPGYGDADLFVTTRLDSTWTNWSKPKNLGDGINSTNFDAYLTITGSQAFFVSNRYGRSADIYTARAITQEERDRELANRIVRRGGVDSLAVDSDVDAETQALLAETQALLSEFEQINQGKKPASGASGEKPAQFVYFNLNADQLSPEATPALQQVADALKKNPTSTVELVGHADDTGGSDYNLKLSISRAQAAKDFLVRQGIDVGRIITYGRGSTQPLSAEDNPAARQKNRRVEIKIR